MENYAQYIPSMTVEGYDAATDIDTFPYFPCPYVVREMSINCVASNAFKLVSQW